MGEVFSKSLLQWRAGISVDSVLMLFMALFALIGAIDKIFGDRHGYGTAFTEGFCLMGPLALAVAAIYAAAPLLARLLTPMVTPLFSMLGADPCSFAGIVLPSDMGGYALAMKMTSSPALGNFSGLILGGTVGSIWAFTLPVALSVLEERDKPYFAAGLLCGLITIPIGCLVGGLLMRQTDFSLSFQAIVLNTIPVAVLAILVGAGLWLKSERTVRIFGHFGKAVTIAATVLTAIAVFEQQTGILLPFFDTMVEANADGLTGFDEGLLLCGKIALVLSGAFPMMLFIKKHGAPLFSTIERILGIDSATSLGLMAACTNCLPAVASIKDMNDRGKILTAAFIAGGGFVFGDYLGFTASAEPQMIMPMLGAKLTSGILGILLASLLSPVLLHRIAGAVCSASNNQ